MNNFTKLLILICFSLSITTVSAATIKSVKPNANTTFDWDDPTSWEGGVVPLATDDVQLQTNSGVIMTMRVPTGTTVQCTDLILPGSINIRLLLETGSVLEMTGSIFKTGTSFVEDMINSNGTGTIRFVGLSRNIAPGGDFEGIKSDIPGWNCEIALDAGQIATTYGDGTGTENFKCGSLTVSSGTFAVGNDNADTNYDYVIVDQGANGQGNILVKAGATLISKAIGRRPTSAGSTGYINDITIEDGAFLNLKFGGGSLNAETVAINGTLQMDGTTTLRSVSSTSPNGDGDTGITYGANAHLIYTNRTSGNKAFGGEISRAYAGTTTPPTVNMITINSTNQTDIAYKILTTVVSGGASFANSVKISGELVLNGKIEIGNTGTEYVELLEDAVLTTDGTINNYITITSKDATDQLGFIRYVKTGETLLFPVAMDISGTSQRFRPFLITNNGAGQSFAFASTEPDSWAIDGDDPALFPAVQDNFTNSIYNDPAATAVVASGMVQDTRWNIETTSGSGDIIMKIGFDASDPSIGADLDTNPFHGIFHNNLGGADWDVYTADYLGLDVSLYNLATITGEYSGTFSPFAWGSNGTVPLPLELVSFTARQAAKTNLLEWVSATEENVSHFNVQRSKNGEEFEDIAKIEAVGNSASEKRYSFIDENPLELSYYRLEMVDTDGTIEYSKTLLIQRNEVGIHIYPNPVRGSMTISLDGAIKNAQLRIMDVRGATLVAEELSNVEGIIELEIAELPKGMYILRINDQVKKFFKN